MNAIKEMLRFTAKMIDGELYEYEDGWIIETFVDGQKVLFSYDLNGDFESVRVKE